MPAMTPQFRLKVRTFIERTDLAEFTGRDEAEVLLKLFRAFGDQVPSASFADFVGTLQSFGYTPRPITYLLRKRPCTRV